VIPVCTGRGFFRVSGNARVLARGFAEVEADELVRVDAGEHAIVHASGGVEVEASGDAEVHTRGKVTIVARGHAIVYAGEGANVFVSELAWLKIEGQLASYRDTRGEGRRQCPLCGGSIDDWVCTNKRDCGYILCSICADGDGGSNTQGRQACPHFAVMLWEDDQIYQGIDLDVEFPIRVRMMLDDLTRAAGGVARDSVFLGGAMGGNGTWTDYFVPDLAGFERRVEERVRELSPLTGTEAHVFAIEPALLLGVIEESEISWPTLAAAGVRHVVDLIGNRETPTPAPLEVAVVPLADEKYYAAADLVASHLTAGEGVAVYGVGETAVTGTLAGCALLRLGLDFDDVRNDRMPDNWPQSPSQVRILKEHATAK
jgi:hypothetical protein